MQISYDSLNTENHVDDIVFDEPTNVVRFDMTAIEHAFQRHLDDHKTLDQNWPADSTYAIKYRYRTWPCGWDNYYCVRFFSSSDELSEFVKRTNIWALEEDNDWEFTLYMWDLGPELISDVSAHVH